MKPFDLSRSSSLAFLLVLGAALALSRCVTSCAAPKATVKLTRTAAGKEVIEVSIPQTAVIHGPNIAVGAP